MQTMRSITNYTASCNKLLREVGPTASAEWSDEDAPPSDNRKNDCASLHGTYQSIFRKLCESSPRADNLCVQLNRLLHTFRKNDIYCHGCAQVSGNSHCAYSEYHREFSNLERTERLSARKRIIKYFVHLQTIWIVAASDGMRELLPNTPAKEVVTACYKHLTKPCLLAKTDTASCERLKNLTNWQRDILQKYDNLLLEKDVTTPTNDRAHKECCSLVKRARTPDAPSKQRCTTRKRVRFEEPPMPPAEQEIYEHRIKQLERRIEALERYQSKDSQDMLNSVVTRLTQHINNIRHVTETTSQQVARMHVREELRVALRGIFGVENSEILAWVESKMQNTPISNV
ncbi:hypothetical protein CYMTET_4192 [Cymbomonas tetramitiformis]|uniref:Uncharacterized protein n=1 Tax=Cymbomonas tetramitiformis TaxID=36881 RepID=A0AAE0LKB1_9CHLO|nr:hypothetical protein CYMTET_4192 [Cymbomonas tetramitiformis]